jgi:hypothetical protein
MLYFREIFLATFLGHHVTSFKQTAQTAQRSTYEYKYEYKR